MDARNETIFTTRFYREFGNFTAWCLAPCKSLGRIVLSWAWRSITGWYSQVSDKKGLNIDCVKFYDFLLNFRIVEFSSNFFFFCTVLFFRSYNAMCYTREIWRKQLTTWFNDRELAWFYDFANWKLGFSVMDTNYDSIIRSRRDFWANRNLNGL